MELPDDALFRLRLATSSNSEPAYPPTSSNATLVQLMVVTHTSKLLVVMLPNVMKLFRRLNEDLTCNTVVQWLLDWCLLLAFKTDFWLINFALQKSVFRMQTESHEIEAKSGLVVLVVFII